MPLKLDIVTVERLVYSQEVDMVIAPGIEGELGILPRHAPLLTALAYGELRAKRGSEEDSFAIGGGFMEVQPDHVTVLADAAEYAEEIDMERAEAARRRAEERLQAIADENIDYTKAEAALRRSLVRIKVAQARRRRGGRLAETKRPGVGTPSE
jgi:F-type H+-transporting ATPase subunit epsilon